MADVTQKFKLVRYSRDGREDKVQKVIREVPLTVYVNNEELVTLLCTPDHIDYLALGFLWSEGIIDKKSDITKIDIDEEKGSVWIDINKDTGFIKDLMFKRLITSGCGKGTSFYSVVDSVSSKPVKSEVKVASNQVIALMKYFQDRSELYKETHGVHSAALCTSKRPVLFHDDIGRHNAVDKILGEVLLKDVKLDDKLVLTSGRISSEVLLKVAKKGISVLVSRTSPTNLAIGLADKLNVTLVGFVRGGSMSVYTHGNRIGE